MLKVAYSPVYDHPLPPGHRFPMEKYSLLPLQLVREGIIRESEFFIPSKYHLDVFGKVHSSDYLKSLIDGTISKSEERRIGFKYSPQLVEREFTIVSGTIQNALFALDYGCSFNIAGGTHHAYADHGEGFCLLNDIAVAAQYILDKNLVKKVLVVDLDVHQGNGTAKIFEGNQSVFTFSMHGEKNYPLRKETSDLDIELADGIKDEEYLSILETNLLKLIDLEKPDFIFYQAGVDILESDKLGRLNVTIDGCRMRDKIVFKNCQSNDEVFGHV